MITKTDLQEVVSEIHELEKEHLLSWNEFQMLSAYEPEYSTIGIAAYRRNAFSKDINPKEYITIPFPNFQGGVTAVVNMYGAVNVNSKNPEAAYRFLETLLSEDVQCGMWGAGNYYFSVSGTLSVKKSAIQNCIDKTCSTDTAVSYEAALDHIDSVKFYTEMDIMLMNTKGIYDPSGFPGTTESEEVIRLMQMHLDE